MMHTDLSRQDLSRLAALSSAMVNSIDSSEQEKYDEDKITFLHLLDHLDQQYQNCEILFDARAAVSAQPFNKLDLYTVTRELVRGARYGGCVDVHQSDIPVSPMISGVMVSYEQTANALVC